MKSSAVLLITFNRPDNTKIVFDKIVNSGVKKLYVFNDGPRDNNEEDQQARVEIENMLKEYKGDCDIRTLFSKTNYGCGPGPVKAITWAFEKEDRLIILEDDCVASRSFFGYCDELLERYLYDTRVWLVSGNNYNEEYPLAHSYRFTRYGHTWGWATWKRCWNEYDFQLKKFPEFLKNSGLENVFFTKKEAQLYKEKYFMLYGDEKMRSSIWDFQWGFAIQSNNGLSIMPAKNLVKNIGIQGTHAQGQGRFHNRKIYEDFKITSHPSFVLPDRQFELYHFDFYRKIVRPGYFKGLRKRIIKKVAMVFH